MASYICERATEDAIEAGCALLRFIQPNDLGLTGSHQAGYYLPKPIRELYTDIPPLPGTLRKQPVEVHWWQIGNRTRSNITWYGNETRREYRLTGFGRGFPFMQSECLGDLLVLVPHDRSHFNAYVLDLEEDFQFIQSGLGLDVIRSWGAYHNGTTRSGGTSTTCIRKHTKGFVDTVDIRLPEPDVFASTAREILSRCVAKAGSLKADGALMQSLEIESALFELSERKLYESEMVRRFRDVGDFVRTAITVINRRNERAGLSLGNQVSHLLERADIPHEINRGLSDGRSEIVIPSLADYQDVTYPAEKVCVVGVKPTCKDRWREVLESPRGTPHRHILTTQRSLPAVQLDEMHEAGITLVVPDPIRGKYQKGSRINMLNFEQFIGFARTIVPA